MLLLCIAGQLLLLAQFSLAATIDDILTASSSDSLLIRSKRSTFEPSPNCPEPVYLTQSQVSEWPGITVDTAQKTIVDDIKKLNTFKCSDDTFFVYTHLPTVMTRQNWWIVCGTNLKNGWRVTDAGGRNTAYGMIPVGCVKPTCTGLQLFDGSEFVLSKYPTYQVVPNKPSLIGINQKFQFTCPVGSTIGFAASQTTITLDVSMKITCEAEGWWMRTKADLTGQQLSAKVGCFKQVAAPPTTLPAQCQTGITYFTVNEKITHDGFVYAATADKAVIANGQWALVCPSDTVIGYSDTAFTLDATMRITCESAGWRMKTKSNLDGQLLSAKVGCFKQIEAVPLTLPTQCETRSYYTDTNPISSGQVSYVVTADKPVYVNGKWTLVCSSDSVPGLKGTTLQVEPTLTITCESIGWWMDLKSQSVSQSLPNLKFGCFRKLAVPTCRGPEFPLFDGSEPIIAANAATYQLVPTVPRFVVAQIQFVCPSGTMSGYAETSGVRLLVEPLKITCESTGWWVKAPLRVDRSLSGVKVGCFRELPSSAPAAPVSTITKTACGCWYEPSTCRSCDLQKLFVLDGLGLSGRCTLGCAKGYVLEGSDSNMLSCYQGWWFGSSKATNKALTTQSGPFGYIMTNCVPETTPATCSLQYSTFECVGCDKSKIIPLTPKKSSVGCVLACDKDYRLVVQDASLKVTRAQEAVAEQGSFTVYPLGIVNSSITITSSGAKFSCELTTTDITAPVVLVTPAEVKCAGTTLQLFDGSESVITSNAAAYQFVSTVPMNVGGKMEFVCPDGTITGYAQSNIRLMVESLKLTCESAGWWVKSTNRPWSGTITGLLPNVKVGCFKELLTSAVTAPVSTIPRPACGCWYEPSTCRSCDLQKLFVLDGHGATSGRCTLGCGKGYVFEGGDMNMISCDKGYWLGSSSTVNKATVPLVGPMGYILTSCVPEPKISTCSIVPTKFDCLGCDSAKIISLTPTKSTAGCVLSCDKNYRLLVQDSSLKITRAQEVVADQGSFTVYPLGTVTNAIAMPSAGVKFSCEIATSDITSPVILNPPCSGLKLFDGTESVIVANLAVYEFIPAIPTSVGGKLELVCATGFYIGYAQGEKMLSVEPLKVTCESTGWWIKADLPNRVNGPLSGVKVGCFKEIPTSTPSAPVSTLTKEHCGCWYEPSTCRTCDLQKLFVLDGQGAMSGRCTLGCANGYVFEGGEMNMISCEQGYWFGSSRSVANTVVSMSGPFGYITTSCVPAPTPATCSQTFATFVGFGCDFSKIIGISSSKSKTGCVLACDKNFRLVVMDSAGKVIRAQEAVTEQASVTVYPLGTVKNPIVMTGVKFSCEPTTADVTMPVGSVAPTQPPTTFTATQPPTPAATPIGIPPNKEKYTCGCPYDFTGCPTCDWKQLFRIDGFTTPDGRCTLVCNAGYMFEGGKVNILTCKGSSWVGSSRTTAGASVTVSTTNQLATSCIPVPSSYACSVAYTTFVCQGGYCDPNMLVAMSSTKSACVLTCTKKHRLLVHDAARTVTRAQEAYAEGSVWKVYALGETVNTISMSATGLKFSCESASYSHITLVPL